jgi:hypothetical protein
MAMTLEEIRRAGLEALVEKLGPVDHGAVLAAVRDRSGRLQRRARSVARELRERDLRRSGEGVGKGGLTPLPLRGRRFLRIARGFSVAERIQRRDFRDKRKIAAVLGNDDGNLVHQHSGNELHIEVALAANAVAGT